MLYFPSNKVVFSFQESCICRRGSFVWAEESVAIELQPGITFCPILSKVQLPFNEGSSSNEVKTQNTSEANKARLKERKPHKTMIRWGWVGPFLCFYVGKE